MVPSAVGGWTPPPSLRPFLIPPESAAIPNSTRSPPPVRQEKGEELVDQLSAEAEVMRELEEERRRLEAARREALKARIRAEKGLPAAPTRPSPPPFSV